MVFEAPLALLDFKLKHTASPQPYPPEHTLPVQAFAGSFSQGCATFARLDASLRPLYRVVAKGQQFQCGMGFIRFTFTCSTG
jgi:hypothetical protein